MLRSPAVLGIAFVLSACATSAPGPDGDTGPAETVPATDAQRPLHEPGTGLQGGDTLPVRMHQGEMRGGMGARMGADSAEAGMGHGMHHRGEGMQAGRGEGMHHQGEGMQAGRGEGMHHQGEGMQAGRGEGMHHQGEGMQAGRGEGMHHQGEGMHRQGMGEGMGRGGMQGQMGATDQREVPEDLQEGERIFKEICSVCHTMDPPPNLAPPMSHVARHLRQEFDTEEAAVAHVVEYLPAPARERSILPDMPHERFGLMAPQPLPTELLEAVGRYVWFLGGES
jgi:hypothetical protein